MEASAPAPPGLRRCAGKAAAGSKQRASARSRGWLARLAQTAQAAMDGDATEVGGANEQAALPAANPVEAGGQGWKLARSLPRAPLLHQRLAAPAWPAMPSGIASWQASINLENFDAAVLTPLTGVPALSALTGRIDGKASLSGGAGQFSADGDLSCGAATTTKCQSPARMRNSAPGQGR